MTDDNTFNVSKIDTRVREAANNYSISKYKHLDGIGYVNQPCVEDFTAGVQWERERSRKLIEALKEIKFYEESYDFSSPEESTIYLIIVKEALKEYEGEK